MWDEPKAKLSRQEDLKKGITFCSPMTQLKNQV